MPEVPATPVDLLRALTRAERLLARRVGGVLAAEGLTVEAWRVLCLLADGQGHPMSEVAAEESLPPGTLTKLVDQLVDQNLVYRRIDPQDRRRIRAYLTARGRREQERVDALVRADLADLTTDDLALAGALAALVDRLGAGRPVGAAVGARAR
ncbi:MULTISPECIES: MarR family winged helix-turn-helix transcriptional regulator [Micromonospora]|uniref:MarR family transcriptional regulator n=1 Tax=Micromonospora haikouensis TaxID=686309 RepID=A0A0D0V632_9ACTN|nr:MULTISPECIES: MarR family transcriptional regulator [Micromonospora]KIR66342.1 MarR family transcriptional regulator [Micromonospora haikouensis]